MEDPPTTARRQFWIFALGLAVVIAVAGGVVGAVAVLHHPRKPNHEADFALPFTGVADPRGIAVDGAGNVYVADIGINRVLKLAAGSNTQTVLPFTGLKLDSGIVNYSIAGVAVDRAGDVYVVDSGNNRVLELPAGSSTQTVLPFDGLAYPSGVAVGTAGDVYVVDPGHDSVHSNRVLKLAAGSSSPTVLPPTGRATPDDVAVDAAGNVYATVFYGGRRTTYNDLLKLSAGSDTWTQLPSAGVQQYVATDGAGNVYVITSGDGGGVTKLTPGARSWTEMPAVRDFRAAGGLAVDARGNVYVTDNLTPGRGARSHGLVVKLPAQ